MEENIKRAWKDLVDELRPLDESWPPKLVFIHTPTMASSKYTTCIDPLRPNDGPCALDIDNANNSHFLRIQTLVARNIDLYQEFDTDLAKRFLEDLHTTAIGLEEVKRDHWERGRRLYNFDSDEKHPLERLMPPVATLAFVPLLLQTKGISRRVARFILRILVTIVAMVVALSPEQQRKLVDEITRLPRTPDHICEVLKLETPYTRYICCPNCFSLYDADTWLPIKRPLDRTGCGPIPPPVPYPESHPDSARRNTMSNALHDYLRRASTTTNDPPFPWTGPSRGICTYRSTPNSNPCGARLTVVANGRDDFEQPYDNASQKHANAQITPRLTYYVANLHHWIAELITRPGMKSILQRPVPAHDHVHDIMESKAIQGLIGPNGRPFIGPHVRGIHLCFALFMDFFNSEGNFIGGKHNSTGGIFVVILNLPIELRYAPENMFPVFTPGGREPTTEELNSLLRPLVDQLIILYQPGITVSIDSRPVDIRAMLALIIADTPAAKKIGGFASHAHRWFCHMCRLSREDIERNLDPSTWPQLSLEHHAALAKLWLNAPSVDLRDELFNVYGIRYSEIQRIPYIKMTECIGAEPMHAIMQNTIQHHIRKTFGINAIQGDMFFDVEDNVTGATEAEISYDEVGAEEAISPEVRKGLEILNRPGFDSRSLDTLVNMRVDTLMTLCEMTKAPTMQLRLHKQKPMRVDMVEALAVNKHSQPSAVVIDSQVVQDILSLPTDDASRKNRLVDLPLETLYESCSLAGIDTSSMPLHRGSIYPTEETMSSALLKHTGGFDQRASVAETLRVWKTQRALSQSEQPASLNVESNLIEAKLPHFNLIFLNEIWSDISKTDFPEEVAHDAPPRKLGSKQHGRLKASQWRTVCCFTMLITLGRIWGRSDATSQDRAWLENYLHLVVLVRIAYNHSITKEDISAFRRHSIDYVEGLRAYHPSSIKPSHHFLLHLADQMERLGPMRGWWAFPFERFNGQIQRLNNNNRLGGLIEKSFMTQWFSSSKIRTVLGRTNLPALHSLRTVADQELGTQLVPVPDSVRVVLKGKDEPLHISSLSDHTREALSRSTFTQPFHDLRLLRKAKVRQSIFEPYSSSYKNGFVEYPTSQEGFHAVGYIHELFQYTPENFAICITLACIAQCARADEQFLQNRLELGARLCGRDIDHYTIVILEELSHVVRYPWGPDTQLVISVHNLLGVASDEESRLELGTDWSEA